MINKLRIQKILWLIIACLSLFASLMGILNQKIYDKVVGIHVLPGTISQDTTTIVMCSILFVLTFSIKKEDIKKEIVALSLIGYVFYAYGIYVIEQLYNSFYLIYIAIFGVSFWTIIYGLINIKGNSLKDIKLTKTVRYISIVFLFFIPFLFYMIWIGQLLPLMETGDRIEYGFSIFILDMVFILPALIITGIMIIKRKILGFICAPILFFKAFTLLFSVGLGGLYKPLFNQTFNLGETIFYFVLSLIFLVLAFLNFWKLDFSKKE